MTAVLEVKNATKVYRRRGGATLVAADNVSFDVNEGEILGFLGPNGAGKSTVIKMITGMASLTSGEIFILGNNIERDRTKAMRHVGGVIENPDLYLDWSGEKNLKYFVSLHPADTLGGGAGASKKEIDAERVRDVLDIVGMTDRKDDAVKKYSLGMKQRIGIAQALLNRPKLLILDEPANGLDPAGIREIRDLLKKLAHEFNMAILVSSHLLAEMQLMCDRILIIKNGKIVAEKNISELDENDGGANIILMTDTVQEVKAFLFERFQIEAAQSGKSTLEFRSALSTGDITKEIILAGYNIFSIQTKEASLEDVFIDVTQRKEGGENVR